MRSWRLPATLLGACMLLVTPITASAAQRFVIVVNAENPAVSISADDASRLFLKRVRRWPDGRSVEAVDLPARHPARDAFTRAVHGRSLSAVRAYWQQQIFSGRDIPPVEKADERALLEYVRDQPGGVGYVAAGTPLIAGVKLLPVRDQER